MKTMTVGDLKTQFSEVIQRVKQGEEIAVAFGKKKEIVAYLIPKTAKKPKERRLGILEGKGRVEFDDDFKITEEQLLAL